MDAIAEPGSASPSSDDEDLGQHRTSDKMDAMIVPVQVAFTNDDALSELAAIHPVGDLSPEAVSSSDTDTDTDSSSDVSDTVSIRTTRSTTTAGGDRPASPYDGFDFGRQKNVSEAQSALFAVSRSLKGASLQVSTLLSKIGYVRTILDNVVVVEADRDSAPLDLDSALFLSHRTPLGRIFDVFGPVIRPLYSVRFDDSDFSIPTECSVGSEVFIVPGDPQLTSYVFVQDLRKQKGTDASWEDNEELPPEMEEFSDDEKERAHRQQLQSRKRSQPATRESNSVSEIHKVVQQAKQLEKKKRKPRKNRKGQQDSGGTKDHQTHSAPVQPSPWHGPADPGTYQGSSFARPTMRHYDQPNGAPPQFFQHYAGPQTLPEMRPVSLPHSAFRSHIDEISFHAQTQPRLILANWGAPQEGVGKPGVSVPKPVSSSGPLPPPTLEEAKPLVTDPKLLPSAQLLFYNPKEDKTLTEKRPQFPPRNFMRF